MQHPLSNDNPPVRNPQSCAAPAPTVVSRHEFTACVDRCVTFLLAPAANGDAVAGPACAQLRDWLHAEATALDDGRPINLSLFDATILGVEERVPVGSTTTRTQLLRAARQLAESIYADVAPRRVAGT